MNYKIYIKELLIFILIILIGTLINTTLYYFDITNTLISKIITITTMIIALITSGYLIGKKSTNRAYKNGLILGSIIIIINIILNLIFNLKLSLLLVLYYLLILVITTTSSIIGINKKK